MAKKSTVRMTYHVVDGVRRRVYRDSKGRFTASPKRTR